jgi:peptide/nickel transport system ATP-binding protein
VSLLAIENFSVEVVSGSNPVRIVDGVSLSIDKGETLGLVGESGCGKTFTAMSSIGLLPSGASCSVTGSVRFRGMELTQADDRQLRQLWGNRIGVVFQNPMTSLNPALTIGFQLTEVLLLHQSISADEAKKRVLRMLDRVGLQHPEHRLLQYPHELSGGQRQRIMIAMALMCRPDLLIADEPTTALDVTLQLQIMLLLRALRDEMGLGVLLITHDLGLVAEFCDRVVVMYAGRIVEVAPVKNIFKQPLHPYTMGLLNSVIHMGTSKQNDLPIIDGMASNPKDRKEGCAFFDRCKFAIPKCRDYTPTLTDRKDSSVACWNPQS